MNEQIDSAVGTDEVDAQVIELVANVSDAKDEGIDVDGSTFLVGEAGEWGKDKQGNERQSLQLMPADFLQIHLSIKQIFNIDVDVEELKEALIARSPQELKRKIEETLKNGYFPREVTMDDGENLIASSDKLNEQMKGSVPLTVARLTQYIRTKLES